MRMTVMGWDKNHGEKQIFDDESAEGQTTRVQVEAVVEDADQPPSAIISHVAPMKLHGNYLIRMTLRPAEIARLFYLTHANLPAWELIRALARQKELDDEAKAKTVAARKAVQRR